MRELAVSALLSQLDAYRGSLGEFATLDRDSSTRLITALAETDAPGALELAAMLAGVPAADTLSIIGPLWRLLARPETWYDITSLSKIATALLRLCHSEDGLRELQSQPSKLPNDDIGTNAAYPFLHGLPPDSNLPALLAAVWKFNPQPDDINTYIDMLHMNPIDLLTLERAHRRRAAYVKLYWPARLLMAASTVASVALIFTAAIQGNWQAFLIEPHASWKNLLYIVPVAASGYGAIMLANITGGPNTDNFLRFPPSAFYHEPTTALIVSHFGKNKFDRKVVNPIFQKIGLNRAAINFDGRVYLDPDGLIILPAVSGLLFLPIIIAVRIAFPAATLGIVGYLVASSVVAWAVFWLPATRACSQDVKVPLRRRHPLIGLYEDPQCGHWLVPLR